MPGGTSCARKPHGEKSRIGVLPGTVQHSAPWGRGHRAAKLSQRSRGFRPQLWGLRSVPPLSNAGTLLRGDSPGPGTVGRTQRCCDALPDRKGGHGPASSDVRPGRALGCSACSHRRRRRQLGRAGPAPRCKGRAGLAACALPTPLAACRHSIPLGDTQERPKNLRGSLSVLCIALVQARAHQRGGHAKRISPQAGLRSVRRGMGACVGARQQRSTRRCSASSNAAVRAAPHCRTCRAGR